MEDLASSTSFRGRASLLAWPALLLIAAKCGRGIAAHTSWQFLADGQLPVVVWTFLLLLVASLPYLLRQPWKSGRKRLRTKLWVRVAFNAGLYALEMTLWHFCLSLYGPIRTLLMVDYAGVMLEPLFHLKQAGASGKRGARIQGSLVAVAAYALLFAFDSPAAGAPDEEWGLADKLGGAVAVAAAIAIAFARRRYQAKLALQVGSDKRVTALSTVMGAGVLLPFALYAYLFSWEASAAPSTTETSSMSLCLALAAGAALFVVGNAWAEHAVRARFTSPAMPTKLGLAAGVGSAILAGWLWGPSAMSSVTLVTAALLAFGVHRRFQGEPEVGVQQHAIFTAGGADEGLPTEAFSAGSSHGGDQVWGFFKNTLKEILANGESRSIFLFLLINLAFMGVEVAYGYWTNSLGLISDGFHMLFDCTALFIGLYASVISKWKPNKMFTYGYGRVEVVSGFVNGIFLVFIALFVLLESIERFVEPPKIETDRLLLVASLGLGVNLIGVFAFAHGHAHGGHGHSHGGDDDDHAKKKKKKKKHDHGHSHSHGHGHDHGHSHGHGSHNDHHDDHDDHDDHHDHHDDHGHDHGHSHSHKKKKQKKYAHSFTGSTSLLGKLAEPFADFFYRLWHEGLTDNLSGIWLHVMADTLGSVGVIFSSFCIMNFGWTIADPICSFFIALTILLSVIPLLKQCSVTLALRTPNSLQKDVDKAVLKTTRLEGVLGVRDVHVWKLAGDTVVATLHVHVQNHVEEQKIIKAVKGFFGDVADNLTIQVEKERFYELQTRLQKQPLSLPASGLPLPAAPFSPQVGPSAGVSSSSSSSYFTSASRAVGPASSSSMPPPSGPSSFYHDAGPSSILVSTSDDDHHHHHHHDDHDDHHDHHHHDHHHYSDHHHPIHEQHIDISVDKNL